MRVSPIQTKKKPLRKNPQFEAMKRKRKMTSYSSFFSRLGIKLRSFKYVYIALAIIFIIVLVGAFIFRNSQYSIKNVQVYGNNRISTDSINTFMQRYIDKNLVSLSRQEVLSEAAKSFIELDNINLIKVYPNTLKVEVVETSPGLVYFNFNSTELISNRGEVVGKIDSPGLDLSDTEVQVAQTGGDPNAEYVKSRLQGAKEGAFVWDEVTQEDRLKALVEIKSEIDLKISDYISKTLSNIQNTSFKDLLVLYRKSSEDAGISESMVKFALGISEKLNSEGLNISKVCLLNKFDFAYEIKDGKTIVFTTRRNLDLQMKDLGTVISNNQLGSGTYFDFRSTNFSIR